MNTHTYAHTHTRITLHMHALHIYLSSKSVQKIREWCMRVDVFFFTSLLIHTTRDDDDDDDDNDYTTTSVCRREGPIVAPIYMSAQYRHSQLPGRIAKSQEGHIYICTSPSRSTMTP
jgi:hypothetical protein